MRFLAPLILLLSACTGPYVSDMIRQPATKTYPGPEMTYLMFRPDSGFTVEYISNDGRTMMWVPGTHGVVQGVWQILGPIDHAEDTEKLVTRRLRDALVEEFARQSPVVRTAASKLCRNFTGRDDAPVTSMNWRCTPLIRDADSVVGELRGDPFNLGSGHVPVAGFQRCIPPEAFRLMRDVSC